MISREWLVTRKTAAIKIQAFWKGSKVRRWYLKLRAGVIFFQAAARGHLLRQKIQLETMLRNKYTAVTVRKTISNFALSKI